MSAQHKTERQVDEHSNQLIGAQKFKLAISETRNLLGGGSTPLIKSNPTYNLCDIHRFLGGAGK